MNQCELLVSYAIKFPNCINEWLLVPANPVICITKDHARFFLLAQRVYCENRLIILFRTIDFRLNPVAVRSIHTARNYDDV